MYPGHAPKPGTNQLAQLDSRRVACSNCAGFRNRSTNCSQCARGELLLFGCREAGNHGCDDPETREYVNPLTFETFGREVVGSATLAGRADPPMKPVPRRNALCPRQRRVAWVNHFAIVPGAMLNVELPHLEHVHRAQPKPPAAGIPSRNIPKPPFMIEHLERIKQGAASEGVQILSGNGGDYGPGYRGICVRVIEPLAGFRGDLLGQRIVESIGIACRKGG